MSDIAFDMARNEMQLHHRKAEALRATLVDAGHRTMTYGHLTYRYYLKNKG